MRREQLSPDKGSQPVPHRRSASLSTPTALPLRRTGRLRVLGRYLGDLAAAKQGHAQQRHDDDSDPTHHGIHALLQGCQTSHAAGEMRGREPFDCKQSGHCWQARAKDAKLFRVSGCENAFIIGRGSNDALHAMTRNGMWWCKV